MRPTTCFSLFAATAFAVSATAAAARDGIMYLVTTTQKTVADKDHKGEQIEIQSFHWGPRQSTSLDGSRRAGGANQMTMDDTAGREKLQPDGGSAGGSANKDMVLKGSTIRQNATAARGANETITVGGGRTESDPDRPVIAGTVPNTASGRRQHGAVTISKEWDAATPQLAKPQDDSSVWIRVGTPWTACRAGTRYPEIALVEGAARYELSDVVVTRCAAGGASLNYAKVKVRAWDPEKKE